ncbi:hypothetical protein C8Q72DRAFT_822406 [Fomitopsis betulina]|nr:hypothetical protein C8Q72DRAFT_822406 [Fomitopsis betulina]
MSDRARVSRTFWARVLIGMLGSPSRGSPSTPIALSIASKSSLTASTSSYMALADNLSDSAIRRRRVSKRRQCLYLVSRWSCISSFAIGL